jgi:hypothetical protein
MRACKTVGRGRISDQPFISKNKPMRAENPQDYMQWGPAQQPLVPSSEARELRGYIFRG